MPKRKLQLIKGVGYNIIEYLSDMYGVIWLKYRNFASDAMVVMLASWAHSENGYMILLFINSTTTIANNNQASVRRYSFT